MENSIYILTGNNHYFECNHPINAGELSSGTELYISLDALYNAVCNRLNLTIDEINALEYIINPDASISTPRGYTFIPTENSIEEFLNNYAE